MNKLIHNYSTLAGRTLHWDTSDNHLGYLKSIQNLEAYQRLSDLGFLNTQIDYKYNSHGFRTAEFDQLFDVVCFGCSFTMGTGVHSQDTWPEQLSAITGLTTANLGHAGSSNDTAVRFALHYLPLLRPRYAVWLQTDMHRIELLDDTVPLSLNIIASDTKNPCADDHFIKTWFTSVTNQQLNLQKNTLAFKYLCQTLGIEPIVLDRNQVNTRPFPFGDARDLIHPGADMYRTLAHRIKTILDEPMPT
jgi:lysophospholipase L1-like esterase